ncbi:right-handed parallel beta-helix repeat-containing protein [Rugosimonospora africana]|uniref:Right handed beta helix domain-containing protein n=1 Tax=Rugosimonospora africana TaxID=556532 RepID=A0A8J3QUV5_9ACTN|nr:right-handed parallel beta-helix repeat-containing protein [Rugosimonospora africana]GIH15261.1 hypothetical protein Raf01_34330 [Rugosimonospora africana]
MKRVVTLAALAAAAVLAAPAAPAVAAGTTYYVDCGAATNGSGTSASPWNNLTTVSAFAFVAGDSILLKRGTTCTGAFAFNRSGTATSPITIDAYGTGALPVIDGNGAQTAVTLTNPNYLTVADLEIRHSTRWGLLATSSTTATVTGLTLRGLTVHDVDGGTMDQKYTGLVVVMPGVTGGRFDHVTIDSVTAYDTTMWAGIMVWGEWIDGDRQWSRHAQDVTKRSSNILIQNSTAHDTFGDGIVAYMGSNVTLQHNVAYLTGQQPTQTIGTPNAIWTWASNDVVVQYNEAYDNNSPGSDGGGFDIDYWSTNTTVQYNYAHDNAAYCVGVFGAEKVATVNSIVRYNICANNGFESTRDGAEEIDIATWDGGKISGLQIYGNTVYTTERGVIGTTTNVPTPTFVAGQPLLFKDNLVVSTVANVLGAGMAQVPFDRDDNLYYYTGGSFSSGEAHSVHNQNPLVNSLGYHAVGMPTTQWTLQAGSPAINAGATIAGAPTTDFFGHTVPLGGATDIGADEAR